MIRVLRIARLAQLSSRIRRSQKKSVGKFGREQPTFK